MAVVQVACVQCYQIKALLKMESWETGHKIFMSELQENFNLVRLQCKPAGIHDQIIDS